MLPEGWSQQEFGELATFYSGNTPSKKRAEFWGGGLPWITAKDLKTHRINSSIDTLTDEGYARAKIAPAGSSLVLVRGMTLFKDFPVGFAIRDVAYNQDVKAIVARSGIDPFFLSYALIANSHKIRQLVSIAGHGTGRLETGHLKSYPINVPKLDEQSRIAQILSTWDRAIETTEKLIENSKAQKKALVQQLLTGKKRYSQFIDSNEKRETNYGDLPLDWLFLPIGDIASEQSERAGKNSELPVLSCSKHVGFVDSLQYFKKKVYSDDTSNYKVVHRGCYGFPSNHIEEGSIGYQDICNAGIVSPIYSVFKTSERVHDGYLFRLLKTEHYRQIFQARTNASVDRRGSLRWKEFCKIHVPLPSLTEQQKISETIDTADNELANLSAQLVRLQAQKRALMQQLLTGKRRVKVAA